MIPGAPKYSRVEILFKENASNRILNEITVCEIKKEVLNCEIF